MSRPDPITREMSPCKDCADRHMACHDSCDKYKEWKTRLDELNAERRKYDRKPHIKVDGCW